MAIKSNGNRDEDNITNRQMDRPNLEMNYEDDRLEEQLEWHSRKARDNNLRYRFYQIIIIIISATIPLVHLTTVICIPPLEVE